MNDELKERVESILRLAKYHQREADRLLLEASVIRESGRVGGIVETLIMKASTQIALANEYNRRAKEVIGPFA